LYTFFIKNISVKDFRTEGPVNEEIIRILISPFTIHSFSFYLIQ